MLINGGEEGMHQLHAQMGVAHKNRWQHGRMRVPQGITQPGSDRPHEYPYIVMQGYHLSGKVAP